jgi:dTDP-4-amino-4,6-dideoxygalactose transaminase
MLTKFSTVPRQLCAKRLGHSSLRGYPDRTFPLAERACELVLSLPLFPGMTAEQVNYVATSVLEVVGKK